MRLLLRNPLFAITAALSLAVGIGADTAVFTIANALLRFSPNAVTEPDRLVEIGRRFEGLPIGSIRVRIPTTSTSVDEPPRSSTCLRIHSPEEHDTHRIHWRRSRSSLMW
jgi:hypothetical protein